MIAEDDAVNGSFHFSGGEAMVQEAFQRQLFGKKMLTAPLSTDVEIFQHFLFFRSTTPAGFVLIYM